MKQRTKEWLYEWEREKKTTVGTSIFFAATLRFRQCTLKTYFTTVFLSRIIMPYDKCPLLYYTGKTNEVSMHTYSFKKRNIIYKCSKTFLKYQISDFHLRCRKVEEISFPLQ